MRIRAWGWISVLLLGSAKSVNLISKPLHKTKVQARIGIHGSWSSLMAGGDATLCQRGSTAKSELETVGGVSGSLNGWWVTQPQLETATTTGVISPWLVRVLHLTSNTFERWTLIWSGGYRSQIPSLIFKTYLHCEFWGGLDRCKWCNIAYLCRTNVGRVREH